jgi:uncharacterized phage-associated protein
MNNLLPNVRRYYAEVGVILERFFEEQSSELITSILDHVSKQPECIQLLVEHESPFQVAREIMRKTRDDWRNIIQTLKGGYESFQKECNSLDWKKTIDDFEQQYLSRYINMEVEDMKVWFNVRKAAQVCAFFAQQNGASISALKLVRLIYLANRKCMEEFDFPLLDDNLVSMSHGPVNAITFDYINGNQPNLDEWHEFVINSGDYRIKLTNPNMSTDDLDELSQNDIEILTETWKNFPNVGHWSIRYYTSHCPEWEKLEGSSPQPIPYERVFKFLGKSQIEYLVRWIMDQRGIIESFAGKSSTLMIG